MAEYIEREALCYQLAKQATIDGQPRAIKRAARIVADFPASDVRPVVRGEWIKHPQWKWIYAECSECKTVFDVKSNFCPNCGAWMEESNEKA